jgi:hypothetical protein
MFNVQHHMPQQIVSANQVMGQALSEIMEQFSMDYITVVNDMGEWLVIRVDNAVSIEFIGKESH